MTLEKRLSRCEQPTLLGRRCRLFGFYEPATPDLDFDEDEIISLPHDQVEFPNRAAPFFRQAGVANCFKLAASELFARVTEALARRAHYGDEPHEATGEKHRRWWMLGPCSASRALCSGEQYPLCSSKP